MNKKTYKRLLTIASSIVYNKFDFVDITDGATFYHADYVTPAWAQTKTKTVEIGDHIFYKWEKQMTYNNTLEVFWRRTASLYKAYQNAKDPDMKRIWADKLQSLMQKVKEVDKKELN